MPISRRRWRDTQSFGRKDELNPEKRYIGYLFGAEGDAAHDTDMAEVDPDSICRRADLPGMDLWENDIFEVEGERGVITYGLMECVISDFPLNG